MERYFNLYGCDEFIIKYLEDLIENSEEINEEIVSLIATYFPELSGVLGINDILKIKEILQNNKKNNEIVEGYKEPVNEYKELICEYKETKTLEEEIIMEHPYLDEDKVLFLIQKFGKKNIQTVLIVKLCENENWFDDLQDEYKKYKKEMENEKKKEKQIKKIIYEKYSDSVLNPNKTYKPLILNTKKKMIRYRDGKIVSTRGEKYIFETTEF